MTNIVTPGAPGTMKVGVLMPLKTPLVFTAEQFSNWKVSGGKLPEGLILEEGPGITATITGTPTKVETQSAIKVEAAAVGTGEKGTNGTGLKIEVEAAKFSATAGPVGGIVEVVGPYNASGQILDDLAVHGTNFTSTTLGEIALLTSGAVAGFIERIN